MISWGRFERLGRYTTTVKIRLLESRIKEQQRIPPHRSVHYYLYNDGVERLGWLVWNDFRVCVPSEDDSISLGSQACYLNGRPRLLSLAVLLGARSLRTSHKVLRT